MSAVPPDHETLRRSVRTRRKRKEQWEREGERSLAQTLGMIGALGQRTLALPFPLLLAFSAGVDGAAQRFVVGRDGAHRSASRRLRLSAAATNGAVRWAPSPGYRNSRM